MAVTDRLRRARPNVLEQVLRANLLAMIGRLSGLLDTLVRFADMTSLVIRANVIGRGACHKPASSNPQSHRTSPGNEFAKVTQVISI
jgi:hypothetical protein